VGDDVEELITEENALHGDASVTVSAKSISGVINNNQDVIKTLNLVCDYYKKQEPSSPVPMFIERAIRLVGKNFMEALKDVAPAGVDEAKFILGKQHEDDQQ
jgi:type VI secretion system protein ImpA